jgi:hypothetical protein
MRIMKAHEPRTRRIPNKVHGAQIGRSLPFVGSVFTNPRPAEKDVTRAATLKIPDARVLRLSKALV